MQQVQTRGLTLVAQKGVAIFVKLLVLMTLVLTATILEVTLKLYLEEVLLVLPKK